MIPRKRSRDAAFHNETTQHPHGTNMNNISETFGQEIQQPTMTVLHHSSLRLQPGQHTSPVVLINHSCLLLPVCFTAWWYWTRKATQNVARRVAPVLCRGVDTDAECFGDDYSCAEPSFEVIPSSSISYKSDSVDPFHSWQDVVRSKSSDPSVRRVRWFKGWNVRSPNNGRRKKRSNSNDKLREGMITRLDEIRSTDERQPKVGVWNDIEGIELWELPKR